MPLGGYLKSTNLLPGKYIEKGAVIAVMEDQQYIQLQQEYLTTKLKLEFAEKEYIRQRDLNVNKATSDKIFQMAESDYKSLRINLNGLAEKLKLININPYQLSENNISKGVDLLAPINCYVSKINVNIGKFVNPSDVLFELINPNDIHLNLNVYEKDINKIQIGQRLVAYTNNQPNVKHQCQIIQVSRDLSETHAAEVHCHFDHYDQNLLPGMYMNAEIKIKNTLCQVIPQESIVTYEGKNYVFLKLDKNHYSMKEVSIGIRDKDWLEILNYADFIGSCIIRNGAYTLLMKLKNTAEE